MRRLPLVILLLLPLLSLTATADPGGEAEDLRRRVGKLEGRLTKLSKRQLKRFYKVRYQDEAVRDAQHQCYLALLSHFDTRRENRERKRTLRFVNKELKKLRKGYGKLAELSADQVAACEERRTPECERLLQLPDSTETRYYRSEIQVLRSDARREREAIEAHQRMVEQALARCKAGLDGLP